MVCLEHEGFIVAGSPAAEGPGIAGPALDGRREGISAGGKAA
jgi:hypothetical protein